LWVIPRRLNFMCQRGRTHCLFSLHTRCKMEQTVSRNVEAYNSDARESPRRKSTTFRTQRKFEIEKNNLLFEKGIFISLLIVFSWTRWVGNTLIVNQLESFALNSRFWNSKESDRFSSSLQVWYNCSSGITWSNCHSSATQNNLYQIWYLSHRSSAIFTPFGNQQPAINMGNGENHNHEGLIHVWIYLRTNLS